MKSNTLKKTLRLFACCAPLTCCLQIGFTISSLMLSTGVLAQTPDSWISKGTYPEFPFPYSRHEHAATVVDDKFYVIGGRGNKPVQQYVPATDSWMDKAQPPLELHHMQAVSLGKDIYIIGAFTGGFPNEDPVPHIYIYHTDTDQWEQGPEIPSDRRRGAAGAVVFQNKIYVLSGITNGHTSGWVPWVDVFDPSNGSWQRLADAPRSRDHFHAALVGDKIVLAGGRRSGQNGTFNATETAIDVYDISSNSWETLSSTLPTARGGCSAVGLADHVIVIGGESGSQFEAHKEVEALDLRDGNWRSLASMKQGRHGMQAVFYQNQVWVIGGSIERGANELGRDSEHYMEVYTPDVATLILDKKRVERLKVWPNPISFQEQLSIEIPDTNEIATIRFFDPTGKLIVQWNNVVGQNTFELSSTLSPGIYLIEMQQGIKQMYAKLLVY